MLGTAPVQHLKRDRIRVAEQVFQWRRFKSNRIPSDDHILQMARTVHESKEPLPPILVFPVGAWFYVIDGHHRLAAYDTAGWKSGIPARLFEGSLDGAYREALRLNSRDKLQMSKTDKINAAWTLVKKGEDSIKETMRLSGVSKGTVNNMREVWRKLNDGQHGEPEDLVELSWQQARRKVEGKQDEIPLDDWRDAQANKLVEKIHNAKLAGDFTQNADITALALAKLDDNLPTMLTTHDADGRVGRE
jgi:hypothetical protein